MSSVLITGGAGYIGSHAVRAFQEAGFGTVVLDNLSTGVRKNVAQDADFYCGDIADRELVKRIVRKHSIEGALHFAGSVVVPESVIDPAKYYRNNTSRALELVDELIAGGVRQFLFSSTAAVYGIPDAVPVAETAPLRPINPYGWSKLLFEQQLKDLGNAHDITYGILRYFNVAGADPQGRIGQSIRNATHLIKVACELATGQRKNMRLFGVDYPTRDGSCVRDFIHVSDLATAHVAVYEHMHRTGRHCILNCGNGRGYTVREVIAAVEAASGAPLSVVVDGRRPGDPPELIADPSLLLNTVSWRPRFGLREMVETALAWERAAKNQRD